MEEHNRLESMLRDLRDARRIEEWEVVDHVIRELSRAVQRGAHVS